MTGLEILDLELPQALPAGRMHIYRDLLFNNVCSFIDLVFDRSAAPDIARIPLVG